MLAPEVMLRHYQQLPEDEVYIPSREAAHVL